jgi:hypothetical protein
MAQFTSDNLPSPGIDVQAIQKNALANQTAQQDLDDRSTFRAAAPGLVAQDPTATGQAMGANPAAAQAFLISIPQMDQDKREQTVSDLGASAALAGSILNLPADQRAAGWDAGRQTLIASGHKMIPPEQYPGDPAMQNMRNMGLTVQQQLEYQPQIPSVNPQPILGSTPGGGYVGPGGVQGQAPGQGGVSATPLPPPGQQSNIPLANPALAQAESSGNPGAVNSKGYAGLYQFGTGRLASLGMYQPAQGEDPNGNQWQGQLSIPGFPQVKTLADFRANPAAQNAAYQVHDNDIRQAIAATPGADKFDTNGLIGVAHLGGVAGMQRFVASGGQYNPGDNPNTPGGGTHLAAYYQRFSGQQPTQVAANVPPGGIATDASPPAAAPTPQGPVSGLQGTIDRLRQQGQQVPTAPAAPFPPGPTVMPRQGPASTGTLDASEATYAGLPASPAPAQPNIPAPNVPQATGVRPGGYGANGDPAFAPTAPSSNALSSIGAPPSAPQQPNALASAGPGVPATQAAAPQSNALAGMAQPGPPPQAAPTQPQQNALAGFGQPLMGSQGAPAPMSVQQPQQGPALPFLCSPKTFAMIPVPEQPGYYLAQGLNNTQVAQRLPGAPGQGTETTAIGGTAYVKDKQTGQVISTYQVPDTRRTTTVQGPNGTIVMQGNQQVGTIPFSTQPAQIAAYQRDSDEVTKVAQQNTAAEQSLQQTLEARDLAKGLPTGAGGEDRAALSGWLKTYAPDSVYQAALATGFVPNSPQAEQLAKLLLRQAAMDDQQLGGSGGLGMTEKFQKANPNLNMQPESIQAIQNLKAVSQQAIKDYGDGAMGFFNQQQDNILHQGGQYQPLSNFNQAWHSQQNVQTYMAAVDAMNGKPYAQWSRSLAPADQERALSIISRIDPSTTVNGPRGPIGVIKGGGQQQGQARQQSAPASAAPPVGTMMQGYRFNGGDPANPASWARAQ